MGTTQTIRDRIRRVPRGQPFTSVALLDVGSRAAVDQALSRLVGRGLIRRVTRGVFIRPKCSRHVGELPPDPFDVAKAIAEKNGAVIGVHGAEAANRLGLSTQVPAHPVYLTTGSSRTFHLGEMKVTLKHVSPSRLLLAGRPAGLAVAAMRYLGRDGVTPEVIEKIETVLPCSELRALSRSRIPGWMRAALSRREATHA